MQETTEKKKKRKKKKKKNFVKAGVFVCVLRPRQKIQLTMQGEREKRCRFACEGLTFAWNSPHLHVRAVGVHYCKGSY